MTIGSHQSTIGKSQVHLTPKWMIDALGPFDTDPCAATMRPWDIGTACNWTAKDDGLAQVWKGFVWLNPPFHRYEVGRWIDALASHGHGIALVHARTEAGWFEPIWRKADHLFFLADRIKFCRPDGTEQPANSGAPVVLVGFGALAGERIAASGIPGFSIKDWEIAA